MKIEAVIYITLIAVGAVLYSSNPENMLSGILNIAGWVGLITLAVRYFKNKKTTKTNNK